MRREVTILPSCVVLIPLVLPAAAVDAAALARVAAGRRRASSFFLLVTSSASFLFRAVSCWFLRTSSLFRS